MFTAIFMPIWHNKYFVLNCIIQKILTSKEYGMKSDIYKEVRT